MAFLKTTPFQFLPSINISSVLTAPLQLLTNGLVTATNTVTAPLELFGKSLESNNKIVDNTSKTIANISTTLGSTLINQQSSAVTNQNKSITNPFISDDNVISNVLDSVSTTALQSNNILGSTFQTIHQAGDAIIKQISNIIVAIGQGPVTTIPTQPTPWNNTASSKQTLIHIEQGQKSYKISDDVVSQVAELYKKFEQAPTMQINNLWRPIYTTIANDLNNKTNVDQGTKNWLHVADAVATADPKSILYQYVRLGTQKALADKDIHFTDGQFYQASNILVKTLATNLLQGINDTNGNVIVPAGYLPSAAGAYGLVHSDATQALQNLGGTLADWSGITPFGLLDHILGVDTSELNGGNSRPITWYFELLGDVIQATLKAGVSLPNLIGQFTKEFLNYADLFIQGEVFGNGFSSKDQLVNTLTQIAIAYAGDLAGPTAILTNLLNPNTNIVTTLSPFGTTLTGKDGNDVIKGGIGNDKLYGGKGNDLLFGGWGDDYLDGGSGTNVLVGGKGNDTYYVRSNTDLIIEHANEGIDHVISIAEHYVLSNHIENLTLDGSANISGSGNSLDNIIKGNIGNNHLYGGAGNDTLIAFGGLANVLNGGTGNDKLYGSTGNETYEFDKGFGRDVIYEQGGDDKIKFGKDINLDDLIISYVGADRLISIKGTTDQITIKDWNKGTQYQVESVQFHNGDRLDLLTLQHQQGYYL